MSAVLDQDQRTTERAAGPVTDDGGRRRRRSRMVRAILAGGLVLGIGAAVTLAAWNDSEYATGTFTAGRFNLEGSATNGTTFTEHATSGTAAPLTFIVNPLTLSPGDVVYAPFAVRLDTTTTNNATITLAVTNTGSVAGLTYELISPTAWGCAAGTTGTSIVPALTAATSPGSPVGTFNLTHGTAAPGPTTNLCFKVTAGAVTQGQTGTVTWQFLASSTGV